MKNLLIRFTIILFIAFSIFAQAKKYAIIIAVGDYQQETGWGKISSVNDVPLIKNSLLSQGFIETDIMVLLDEHATKKNIMSAFESLKAKITNGDIVVIHYSGHGQQIFDDNNDEADGLDEALIPYDAWAKYNVRYKGENHLRDDELNAISSSIRNTLGKNGQLLVILDSCHSGSATRGQKARGGNAALTPPNWSSTSSEKASGSGLLERVVLAKDTSPMIMVSGASAEELNYEYDGVGSLSYAYTKAMNELGSDFTYRQLFSKIASIMNVIAPRQRPTIEGDIDYKLFNGEYVAQQTYFDIESMSVGNSILNINGGHINGLYENTTVLILPAGSIKADASKALAKGKITASTLNTAIVTLDKPLKDGNNKNYWLFVDQPSFGNIAVKIFFGSSVKDEAVKKDVADYLKKNDLGRIVSDINQSDIIIDIVGQNYELKNTKGDDTFTQLDSSRGSGISELNAKIFTIAQGNYLKSLSIKEKDYEFGFRMVPVIFNPSTGMVGNIITDREVRDVMSVRPGIDYTVLEVTNKGNKDLYISIVEINSAGEISPFFPSNNCTLNDQERKVARGKTILFKDCVYAFAPPYERLLLKGFASDKPLNFQSTVSTRGSQSGSNPLESFLQKTYNTTRGSDGVSVSGKMNGYSTEFIYDIVE